MLTLQPILLPALFDHKQIRAGYFNQPETFISPFPMFSGTLP